VARDANEIEAFANPSQRDESRHDLATSSSLNPWFPVSQRICVKSTNCSVRVCPTDSVVSYTRRVVCGVGSLVSSGVTVQDSSERTTFLSPTVFARNALVVTTSPLDFVSSVRSIAVCICDVAIGARRANVTPSVGRDRGVLTQARGARCQTASVRPGRTVCE
jgi:hypothetical protein